MRELAFGVGLVCSVCFELAMAPDFFLVFALALDAGGMEEISESDWLFAERLDESVVELEDDDPLELALEEDDDFMDCLLDAEDMSMDTSSISESIAVDVGSN